MRERMVLALPAGSALPDAHAVASASCGGVMCHASDAAARLPGLPAAGVVLKAVAATIDVRGAATEQRVIAVMELAKAHRASPLVIVRLMSSDRYDKVSSPRAMPAAAAAVARIAEAARRCGMSVALEAAEGTWMRQPEDAVRVAMRVNRMHVGVAVSLDDFAVGDAATLTQRMRLVMPKLLALRVRGGAQLLSRGVLAARPATGEPVAAWREIVAMGYAGLVVVRSI